MQLMKLKLNAQGNTSIPTEKRAYFNILTATKSFQLFYHQDTPTGRIIDDICTKSSIPNSNNSVGDERCCLFNGKGQILPFNDTIRSLIESKLINNGSLLIVEKTNQTTADPQIY